MITKSHLKWLLFILSKFQFTFASNDDDNGDYNDDDTGKIKNNDNDDDDDAKVCFFLCVHV